MNQAIIRLLIRITIYQSEFLLEVTDIRKLHLAVIKTTTVGEKEDVQEMIIYLEVDLLVLQWNKLTKDS